MIKSRTEVLPPEDRDLHPFPEEAVLSVIGFVGPVVRDLRQPKCGTASPGLQPYVHDLHHPLQRIPIDRGIFVLESSEEFPGIIMEGDVEGVGLSPVPHVHRGDDTLVVWMDPFLREEIPSPFTVPFEDPRYLPDVGLCQGKYPGPREGVDHIRGEDTVCREHACRERYQDPVHPQLPGKGYRMDRSRSPECEEHVFGRVLPRFGGHHPQRSGHGMIDHIQNALDRLLEPISELS